MKLVNGRTDYHGPYDSWQSWHSREADLCVHVQTHEGDEALICGTRLQPTSARNSSRMEASQAFFWSPLWTLPIHLGAFQGLSWWLSSNSEIANRIATEVVTKPETVTLEELFSYIKQEASKQTDVCTEVLVKFMPIARSYAFSQGMIHLTWAALLIPQ